MKISGNLLVCDRGSHAYPQISFRKFEGKEVYGLMDDNGKIPKKIMEIFNESQIYQDLCKQYDVIVKMGTEKDIADNNKYVSRCEIYYKPVDSTDNWFKKLVYALINPYHSYEKIQTKTIKSDTQINAESALIWSSKSLLYQINENILKKNKLTI